MRHDLTPDIVAQLEKQYQDDLARTRAMYSTPWPKYTKVDQFEANPSPAQRWGKPIATAVIAWLIGCATVGSIVQTIDSMCAPLTLIASTEPIRSMFGALK